MISHCGLEYTLRSRALYRLCKHSRCITLTQAQRNGNMAPLLHFLRLPFEIRTKIYEFVFECSDVHVGALKGCRCQPCTNNKTKQDYSILLTCRQCCDEARPAMYSSTTWVFHGLPRAWRFVTKPRFSEGPKYIKLISLSLFGHLERQLLDLLPSLENVTITHAGPAGFRITAKADASAMCDGNISNKVHDEVLPLKSFTYLSNLLATKRKYTISLVVLVHHLRPGKCIPYRWQTTVHNISFLLFTHADLTFVGRGSQSRHRHSEPRV